METDTLTSLLNLGGIESSNALGNVYDILHVSMQIYAV